MTNEHETPGARLTEAQVAEVHGWRQVAEEERRTREIAQERYGNALGEKSALQAQVMDMRPLVELVAEHAGNYIDNHFRLCGFCDHGAIESRVISHEDDCPVLAARALVATWQTPAAPTPDAHPPTEPNANHLAYRPWVRDVPPDVSYAIYDAAYPDDDAAPTPDGREGGDHADD